MKLWQESYRVLMPGGKICLHDLYATSQATQLEAVQTACFKHLFSAATWQQQAEQAGFKVVAWQDKSEYLRGYFAQLIWAGLSRKDIDSLFCPANCSIGEFKPGYMLLVAQKEGN